MCPLPRVSRFLVENDWLIQQDVEAIEKLVYVLCRGILGNRVFHRLEKSVSRFAMKEHAARGVFIDELVAMLRRILDDIIVLAVVDDIHSKSFARRGSWRLSPYPMQARCLQLKIG